MRCRRARPGPHPGPPDRRPPLRSGPRHRGHRLGAGFDGIEPHRDGTGWTTSSAYSIPGAIGIRVAGYVAPGLFGLLTVWAYAVGRTALVLAALALICGVNAIKSGNLFGFLFSGVLAAVAGWVLLDGAALVQSILVLLLAWMLLLGGLFDSISHLLGG